MLLYIFWIMFLYLQYIVSIAAFSLASLIKQTIHNITYIDLHTLFGLDLVSESLDNLPAAEDIFDG